MKGLKTRRFWFLVLTISICVSFGGFTTLSQFTVPSKVYAEHMADKNIEGDEKANETSNHFFLYESAFEWSLTINDHSNKNILTPSFMLPMFWPSLNTPPPDLS